MEFLIAILVVVLAIFGVRCLEGNGWFVRFAQTSVSFFAVSIIFFVGFGVFMWSPVNNRLGGIWVSWGAILANAGIVLAVIAGWWLSLRLIWKKPRKEYDGADPKGARRGGAKLDSE